MGEINIICLSAVWAQFILMMCWVQLHGSGGVSLEPDRTRISLSHSSLLVQLQFGWVAITRKIIFLNLTQLLHSCTENMTQRAPFPDVKPSPVLIPSQGRSLDSYIPAVNSFLKLITCGRSHTHSDLRLNYAAICQQLPCARIWWCHRFPLHVEQEKNQPVLANYL